VQTSTDAEHHQTTWCVQKAITFIEANAIYERPWLFSVNMFDPHHPFDPPESYLRRYVEQLEKIPLPNHVERELDDKPAFQRIDHRHAYNSEHLYAPDRMSDREHRLVRAAYWAMVDLIDAQVGRLLDALEATGQSSNTIVVFTSDHGELLGDHGLYLKGPFFYEPSIRVPLIVAGPGVRRGARCSSLVELADLAPTLLEAAGLKRHPGMQSRSLWPLFPLAVVEWASGTGWAP
jgi:arylsulfatase A-like enzyme